MSTVVISTPCAAVAAWVQMTGAGAEARAITTAPTCPVVQVDGRTRPMTERAAPTGAFPNRVCVAALARGAARIEIDGQILRARHHEADGKQLALAVELR